MTTCHLSPSCHLRVSWQEKPLQVGHPKRHDVTEKHTASLRDLIGALCSPSVRTEVSGARCPSLTPVMWAL